ncbi:MAG: ChaN family lipoprotein [Gammaproteobacteria bacterium]
MRTIMSSSKFPRLMTVAAAFTLLAPLSCATQSTRTTAQEPDWNPRVVVLRDAPTLRDVLDEADEHRVIFVGETHTRLDHHLVQLEVLKYLHRRHGDVAVGVEWFQYPVQENLDAYLAGRIDEAEMLERTGYFERWRFDYRLYRPIVAYAKANGIPLVALNAPAELTRAIGDVGLDGLSADLRARLPEAYDRSDAAYTTRVRESFEQHPAGSDKFQNFLDVMLTWDETMAEQAARHLRAHPGRRMVVMAGSGHVAYRSGIPKRLERRIGERTTVLLVGWDRADGVEAADYVVMSEPRELPPAGLLGAFLGAADGGVRILELSSNSAIGDAGILKDDVLLSIDDAAVDSFAAVKLALLDRAPGDKVTIRYRHRNWLGQEGEHSTEVTLRGRMPPRGHP